MSKDSQKPTLETILSHSEERYRILFESSHQAILIGTLGGELLDVNPAAVALFEYPSREAMLHLDIANNLYRYPQDRQQAMALLVKDGFTEDLELELKSQTAKRLRVKESASAIRNEAGEIVGVFSFLRDVTQQRLLEEQLRQSQKMEAVGRLAGGVAHDFNNLLTAINGYSDLAISRLDGIDDEVLGNAVGEIRKAGKRAIDLTRRLLTLSRHQVTSPSKLSLNDAVTDMEKLLERVIGEDIRLSTQLDKSLPQIYADRGQIEQVILNLAVNARDAMPTGGALELTTRRVHMPDPEEPKVPISGEFVRLRIHDTGFGMEPAVREHAFEPFFTTKGQGQNSGLGLAIVYGIVKQSHGHIEIESVEGEGSTFHIYFPVHAPRAPVVVVDEEPKAQPSLPQGNETVLLVEDEPSVRTLVRQILILQGYRVMAARNAAAAMVLCEEFDGQPDLLLTDVVMPGKSGLALAEDLKKRYRGLKILFMSGYTDSHTGVKLLTQQQAAFLAKPFSPETLARKVREVIDSPAGRLH